MVEKELIELYKRTRKDLAELLEDITFADFYRAVQSGNRSYTLKNTLVRRAVDDTWVNAILEAIPHIDAIVNNPRRYMKREAEVVAIEKARIVDSDSVKHLAAHTNLISRVNSDGTVMPKQILSPYNDESLELYENRFIKTVIKAVSQFVDRRYMLLGVGGNEFSTTLDIEGTFDNDGEVINYSNGMTIHQGSDYFEGGGSSKVYQDIFTIRKYINAFKYSPFMKAMAGTADVRPPISKTNLLTKDPDYNACFKLWEFIDNYTKAGYKVEITDFAPEIGRDTIDDFDAIDLLNYIALKKKMLDFDGRVRSAAKHETKVIMPEINPESTTPGTEIDSGAAEGNGRSNVGAFGANNPFAAGKGYSNNMDSNAASDNPNYNRSAIEARQQLEEQMKEIIARALRKEDAKLLYYEERKKEREQMVEYLLGEALDRVDARRRASEQRIADQVGKYLKDVIAEDKARRKQIERARQKRDNELQKIVDYYVDKNESDGQLQAQLESERKKEEAALLKVVISDALKIEEERNYSLLNPTVFCGRDNQIRLPAPVREIGGLPIGASDMNEMLSEFSPPEHLTTDDWQEFEDLKKSMHKPHKRISRDDMEYILTRALALEKLRAARAQAQENTAKSAVLDQMEEEAKIHAAQEEDERIAHAEELRRIAEREKQDAHAAEQLAAQRAAEQERYDYLNDSHYSFYQWLIDTLQFWKRNK